MSKEGIRWCASAHVSIHVVFTHSVFFPYLSYFPSSLTSGRFLTPSPLPGKKKKCEAEDPLNATQFLNHAIFLERDWLKIGKYPMFGSRPPLTNAEKENGGDSLVLASHALEVYILAPSILSG